MASDTTWEVMMIEMEVGWRDSKDRKGRSDVGKSANGRRGGRSAKTSTQRKHLPFSKFALAAAVIGWEKSPGGMEENLFPGVV